MTLSRRALLASTLAAGASCTRANRVNVLNWSDYIAPETNTRFMKETGIRVRYGTYESAEEMLAKVLTGNSGWDVVVMPQNYVTAAAELGLLARLDLDRLPNRRHLESQFQHPAWDPRLEWSLVYFYGSTGIAFHRSLDPAPRAWADLWDSRWSGKLTMLDDPPDVFAACLKKLGYSINAVDATELAAARGEAIRQKPLVRAYINAEVRVQLAAGDVALAQMWATSAQLAIDDAPDLRFVHPVGGVPLFADCAVILRESGRTGNAHRYLDYLMRPEVAAANAMASRAATPIAPGRALLPAAMRDNPVLYTSPEVVARGEWFAALPPAAQRLRDRMWTEIKSA